MQRSEALVCRGAVGPQTTNLADAFQIARRVLPPASASLGMLLAGVANAATIAVTAGAVDDVVDGNCSLVEALRAANTDQVVDGCAAGDMADALRLPAGITFTLNSPENSTYGPTGLPLVSSVLTIEGNGARIQRDAGASEFRIFAIAAGGDLTIADSTISGGVVPADFPSGHGGGVAIYGGSLTLDSVIVASS